MGMHIPMNAGCGECTSQSNQIQQRCPAERPLWCSHRGCLFLKQQLLPAARNALGEAILFPSPRWVSEDTTSDPCSDVTTEEAAALWGGFSLWHQGWITPTPYPGIVASQGCPGHCSHPILGGKQRIRCLEEPRCGWVGFGSCCCWEHLALPLCPGALETVTS